MEYREKFQTATNVFKSKKKKVLIEIFVLNDKAEKRNP